MNSGTAVVGNAGGRRYTPFSFGQDLLFGGLLWHDAFVALQDASHIPSGFPEFHVHQVAGPP